MDPVPILEWIVLLPAAVCVGTWVVCRIAAAARPRDAIAALGAAAAFCAALYASGTRPSFPLASSEDAWTWVFWIAAGGAVLGIVEAFSRGPSTVRLLVRWAAGAGAAWLILAALVPHALSTQAALGRAAAAGLATELLWTSIAAAAARGDGVARALPLAPALAGGAAILLRYGRSLVMAQAAGALAASVGFTALLSRWRGGPAVPAAAAPFVALAFVGLLLGAHAYLNYGDTIRFPVAAALLLAASAACVAIPRPRLATALALALAVAAGVAAARLGSDADSSAYSE